MSQNSILELDYVVALFERQDIFAHPSELHGAITGMVAGGIRDDESQWLGPLADFYHQGVDFPELVLEVIRQMYGVIKASFNADDMSFALMLPDDDAPLSERSAAIGAWTQGFLLGMGCNKGVLKNASDDINEVIQDFAQISKVASDIDENEENEAAYCEIYEYVRISAVMCYGELAAGLGPMVASSKSIN